MFRKTLLFLAMLLISLPAFAVGPVLDHGGQPLASPVVVVEAGAGPVLDAGGQPISSPGVEGRLNGYQSRSSFSTR